MLELLSEYTFIDLAFLIDTFNMEGHDAEIGPTKDFTEFVVKYGHERLHSCQRQPPALAASSHFPKRNAPSQRFTGLYRAA